MDWSSCIICRSHKVEPLKCPIDSLQKDSGLEVYRDFLENVKTFKELDALPINVDFGAAVTPELLAENRASWHKSCRLKFSKSKLQRAAKKRKRDDSQDETPELSGSF